MHSAARPKYGLAMPRDSTCSVCRSSMATWKMSSSFSWPTPTRRVITNQCWQQGVQFVPLPTLHNTSVVGWAVLACTAR